MVSSKAGRRLWNAQRPSSEYKYRSRVGNPQKQSLVFQPILERKKRGKLEHTCFNVNRQLTRALQQNSYFIIKILVKYSLQIQRARLNSSTGHISPLSMSMRALDTDWKFEDWKSILLLCETGIQYFQAPSTFNCKTFNSTI